MNYLKIYCNFIRKAENRIPPEGYTEKHHTFPKSIFGNNKRVVVLTAREHYIAHALLERICIKRYGLKDRKTIKMIHSHILMKSKGKYYKNRSEEHKKKLSESLKGRIPPNCGKSHSEETKRKIGQKNKGRKASEETRKKLSQCKKGENHPGYGKKRDSKIVNKIAEKKSKDFSIINPKGETIYGKNIAKFCRENGLDKASICNMLNHKRGIKSHKGYRSVPQNI